MADVCVVAPLNDARSGSSYTSGSPMSTQLLHAGSSTQNAWNGLVNTASHPIGAPTMLPTDPFPSTA
ncbi:Uncharacterised protein [Mycobacterium tuberculosis]|nr:Uncharacterised protein [Mycobacterium tuberculosis]